MDAYTQLHMQSLAGAYAEYAPDGTPSQHVRSSIKQYKKQFVETRTLAFQKNTFEMITGKNPERAEARRQAVLKRVTREFWTNFVVKGEETAMLKHLQAQLREEFGQDLQFYYPPGDVQMKILHDSEDGPKAVEPHVHAAIVNRAWKIARDLVESHM